MITAIVQFKLPAPMEKGEAAEVFSGSAPKYQGVPGLVRKYYILAEDGRTAGGVYLWESRAAAEEFYSPAWREFVVSRYGVEPTVTYLETPVIVDNVSGRIEVA